MTAPTMRMHLWLEKNGILCFGMGRVMLLDRIEEYGSLRKAAEDLGMSYRAAWGKLRATEEVLGFALVESVGSRRGGYQLTAAGRVLRDRFRLWFDAVEKTALAQARTIFDEDIRVFVDKEEKRGPLKRKEAGQARASGPLLSGSGKF